MQKDQSSNLDSDYGDNNYENDYGNEYDYTNNDYQMDGGDDQYFNDDDYSGYNQNDYGNYQESAGDDSYAKPYQILPYNSLFGQLSKCLQTAQDMTALPQGWCLLLLRQFKWDIDFMTEYFQNVSKYRAQVGYKQTYENPNLALTKKFEVCDVCCAESVDILENICGHGFCAECWGGHLAQSINSGMPFPKCMSCKCPVLYQTVIQMLNVCYPNDRKLIDRYQRVLCELFSSIHRNFQFCTGVDCNNCIKVNDLNVQTVRCTCGKAFCFKCKDNDHSPCSCEQKKKWVQNVVKEEADAKWMSVNTKLCPWCKKAVERSAGCNYMSCLCGKSFCYLCSRPWEPDHKDHFKCHIYRKSSTESDNRQKQILQKMSHFTERFLDNQATANDNKKIDVFEKRKYLFKVLQIDLSDSEFIESAYKFSIECCETLKWIYAYAYYVKWKDENDKIHFEFSQGECQRHKVNLLKKLAVDLKQFLERVKKSILESKDNSIPTQEKQKYRAQFKTLKASIINYYTMTKTYKQKFVAEIQAKSINDDLFMKKKSSESTKNISRGLGPSVKTKSNTKKVNTQIKKVNNQSKVSLGGKLYNNISNFIK